MPISMTIISFSFPEMSNQVQLMLISMTSIDIISLPFSEND
jgi:hypothetical protein